MKNCGLFAGFLLLTASISAQTTEYWFVTSVGLEKRSNHYYAFVSDVFPVVVEHGQSKGRALGSRSQSFSSQFADWLSVYSTRDSDVKLFAAVSSPSSWGPYSSWGEAESARQTAVDHYDSRYVVVDLPKKLLPGFQDNAGR